MADLPGLFVELDLKDRRFRQAMRQAEAAIKKTGRNLSDFDEILLDTEGSAKKAGGALSGLSKAALGVAAAFVSVQSVQTSFELARTAASANDMSAAFQRAGFRIDEFRNATEGLVSDAQLVQQFNLANQAGITKDAFLELTQVARTAARVLGRDVNESVERLTLGIAKQEKEVLDELGIVFRATEANEKFAKANGLVASALTDAEKRQAFLNEVLRQGRRLVERNATATESASEGFARFDAAVDNATKALGTQLLPFVKLAIPLLTDLADLMTFGEEREMQAFTADAFATLFQDLRKQRDDFKAQLAKGLIDQATFDTAIRGLDRQAAELADSFNKRFGSEIVTGRTRVELAAFDLSGFVRKVEKALAGPSKRVKALNKQFRDLARTLKDQAFRGLFEGAAGQVAALETQRSGVERRFGARRAERLDPTFEALARQAVLGADSLKAFNEALETAQMFGFLQDVDASALRFTFLENMATEGEKLTEDLTEADIMFRALTESGFNAGELIDENNRKRGEESEEMKKLIKASGGLAKAFGELSAGRQFERGLTGMGSPFRGVISEDVAGALGQGLDSALGADPRGVVQAVGGSIGKAIGAAGGTLGTAIGGAIGGPIAGAAFEAIGQVVSSGLEGIFGAVQATLGGFFRDQRFGQAGQFAAAIAATIPLVILLGAGFTALTAGFGSLILPVVGLGLALGGLAGFAFIFAQQTEEFTMVQRAFTAAVDAFIEPFGNIAIQFAALAPIARDFGAVMGELLATFGGDLPFIFFNALQSMAMAALGGVIALESMRLSAMNVGASLETAFLHLAIAVTNVAQGLLQTIGDFRMTVDPFITENPFQDMIDMLGESSAEMSGRIDELAEVFTSDLLESAAQALDDISERTFTESLFEGLRMAGDGLSELGQAASETGEQLLNVPEVNKVAAQRFRAIDAGGVPNANNPEVLGGREDLVGGLTINIRDATFNGVSDIREFAERIQSLSLAERGNVFNANQLNTGSQS